MPLSWQSLPWLVNGSAQQGRDSGVCDPTCRTFPLCCGALPLRLLRSARPEAPAERTRGRVARKLGPPLMTRVTSLIRGLSKDGDRVTLLYIHSRIAEALEAIPTAEPEAAE